MFSFLMFAAFSKLSPLLLNYAENYVSVSPKDDHCIKGMPSKKLHRFVRVHHDQKARAKHRLKVKQQVLFSTTIKTV